MGKGMSKVLENLYVGSFADSNDKETLDRFQIASIVTAMESGKHTWEDKKYLIIAVSDTYSENIIQHFPRAIEFIHEERLKGNGVLVHCMAGASRSVSLVVAYLATVTKLPWRDCLNAVRSVRRQANPNLGFQQQLDLFEREHLTEYRSQLFAQYAEYPCSEQDKNQICDLLAQFMVEFSKPKANPFYDDLPPSLSVSHLGISPTENAALGDEAIQNVTVSPGGTAVGFTIPGNRSSKRYPPRLQNKLDKSLDKSTCEMLNDESTSSTKTDVCSE